MLVDHRADAHAGVREQRQQLQVLRVYEEIDVFLARISRRAQQRKAGAHLDAQLRAQRLERVDARDVRGVPRAANEDELHLLRTGAPLGVHLQELVQRADLQRVVLLRPAAPVSRRARSAGHWDTHRNCCTLRMMRSRSSRSARAMTLVLQGGKTVCATMGARARATGSRKRDATRPTGVSVDARMESMWFLVQDELTIRNETLRSACA